MPTNLPPEYFEIDKRYRAAETNEDRIALLVVDLQAPDPFGQVEAVLARLAERRITPLTPEGQPQGQPDPRQVQRPVIVLANKCDDQRSEADCLVFAELLEVDLPVLPVSAVSRRNLDRLQQEIVKRLDVIRVYARPPGQEPDLNAPFVVKRGSLLSALSEMIHKDFLKNFKFARVWGSAVHPGQMVGQDYVLQDGDIVELHV